MHGNEHDWSYILGVYAICGFFCYMIVKIVSGLLGA